MVSRDGCNSKKKEVFGKIKERGKGWELLKIRIQNQIQFDDQLEVMDQYYEGEWKEKGGYYYLLYVNEEGEKVTFDRVLLVDNNGAITVGAPAISGASVEAKVLKHLKGDKVLVFKKKRRKGYKVKNGHRQYLTQVVIENVVVK